MAWQTIYLKIRTLGLVLVGRAVKMCSAIEFIGAYQV